MNAEETKKKFEAKSYYGDSGKYSPQTHWKRRMGELYGPKYFMSNKDAGQLKHLVTAWGDDCRELVDFAFDNWSKFAHRVKAEAGLTQVPVSPLDRFPRDVQEHGGRDAPAINCSGQ